MRIKDWKAKRAGAAITIRGVDVMTGENVKLVGVKEVAVDIMPLGGYFVYCVDRDGIRYRLAV